MILNKYEDFNKLLIDKYIPIPRLNSLYVPQSICQVNDYYFVGYYYSGKFRKKNSLIYVIDKNGYIVNRVMLDGNYHCGGMDVDINSNSLYITASGGNVNRYNLSDFMNFDNKNIIFNDRFNVDRDRLLISSISGKSSVAYLNIHNGKIYLGNFNNLGKSIFKIFKLDKNGRIILDSEKVLNVPYDNIQGMCIYNYNGCDYYIFSSSYGRWNDSYIYISIFINNKFVTVNKIIIPPMSEQINNMDMGNIGIIFESGSLRYFNSRNKIKYICFLDKDKIFKKQNNV